MYSKLNRVLQQMILPIEMIQMHVILSLGKGKINKCVNLISIET